MKAKEVLKEIRERLELIRNEYVKNAVTCCPGKHRDILSDRATTISEALVVVGDVEKLVARK